MVKSVSKPFFYLGFPPFHLKSPFTKTDVAAPRSDGGRGGRVTWGFYLKRNFGFWLFCKRAVLLRRDHGGKKSHVCVIKRLEYYKSNK